MNKKYIFFLILILIPLVNSVQINNQTIIFSSVSNSTIRFEQNTILDQLEVTNQFTDIYNISTDGARFTSVNATYNGRMGFYGSTNALIYFSNSSVACSNINSCDGNINITLSPNNYSYVLDNFNLTEGVSRVNSPLWISSVSTTQSESKDTKTYNLASNLTSTLNNLTFVANANCPQVGDTVQFLPETSASSIPPYYCSSNQIIFNLTGYDQASSSNRLLITYNKQPQGAGGGGSVIDFIKPDEHLCLLTYNYIKDFGQTDYSKIDSYKDKYSWTSFREYLDNWQFYCSDLIGRSLKEDVICSRVYNMLEETKGNYELNDLNNIRNELQNHIKISNNLLDKYAKNYSNMCSFINKPLSFDRELATTKEKTKLSNQVIFFVILSFIVLFGVYMSIRGNKKEKQ